MSMTRYRNKAIQGVYKGVLKPFFFKRDPEAVHDKMVGAGKLLGRHRTTRFLTKTLFGYEHPVLAQDVLGIHFKNPIGLSAGFDKNAELIDILPSVGFGFAEVGSITGEVCEGNAKPRLWRLPKSNGLVVYYGLKNDGCESIAERLSGKKFKIPIGVSVAMTNCEATTDIDVGIKDVAKAFTTMEPHGSYVTINISCPNTVSGQPFIDPINLEKLLTALDVIETEKPIFIKLSPDLTDINLDEILAVAKAHRVDGIICANLTKKRDNPKLFDSAIPHKGGVSGQAVQDKADQMLSYIYQKEGKRFVLVGCGGVFSAADAYRKIRLGASLVQMITGMIFEGPQVISEINRGLVELLKRDGFTSIQDAVGVDSW